MTDNPAVEFSRPVRLDRLGAVPFCERIEAGPEEREHLARRFGLVALDCLSATVTLSRGEGETILLDATLEAAFVQNCVVTLEPVAGKLCHRFQLLYGPPGSELGEIEVGLEDRVFEPLTGDSVDIGEAVAQELSLALPEFPRHPDAEASPEVAITAADTQIDAPFGALSALRREERD